MSVLLITLLVTTGALNADEIHVRLDFPTEAACEIARQNVAVHIPVQVRASFIKSECAARK